MITFLDIRLKKIYLKNYFYLFIEMFNVAARIFKTTYVANIIFEPDSSGLDNFSLCHRIYHTKPAD